MTPEEKKKLQAVRRYRDARDPLKHLQLGPVQSAFWHAIARYKLAEGANRTGKTTVMLAKEANILRGLDPAHPYIRPIRVLFLVKQRLQASQVVGRKLFDACELPGKIGAFPFIPKWEIASLGQLKVGFHVPYHLVMKNGNEAFFKWSDAPETHDAVKGMKLDRVALDEDAGTLSLLHELYVRLADSRSEYPGFGGALTWSATPEIGNEALFEYRKQCQRGNPEYFRVLIPRADHGAISEETVAALAQQLGEMAEVKVFGSKTSEEVYAVYGQQWNDKRHMATVDYDTMPDDNLWIGYDPGVDHATGIMVAAINREHPTRLNVIQFWNLKKTTIMEEIRIVKEWLAGRRLTGVVYDTNAKNQDKVGQSLLGHMQKVMTEEGILPMVGFFQSQKKHEPGIALVRHFLNPNPDNPATAPLIQVNPSIESGGQIVREQILRLQARKKRRYAGDTLLIRGEDEACDTLRYLVMKRPAWNPDWSCGHSRGVVRNLVGVTVLPVPPARPPTDEEAHWKRLMELSAQAARLRSRGRRSF
jgi:hypothetical protein